MNHALSKDVADLLDEFLSMEAPHTRQRSLMSLKGITRRMLVWFEHEDMEILSVTIHDALRYQAWLSEYRDETDKSYATGTMLQYLHAARRFFDYLMRTERIETNPFRELRRPRLPSHLSRNVLTEAQMGRLLRELNAFDQLEPWKSRHRRYRVHVVAEFLYATGLRIAEACALVPDDIDVQSRTVYVREGKGNKARTAFLTAYAAEVMRHYLDYGRSTLMCGYERTYGHALFGAGLDCVMKVVNGELATVCAALELPVVTTHCFRHSLGTHLLRSGCDMRHIQMILGHESLSGTQVYTRVDKEDLKRSLDEHHPRRFGRGRATDGTEGEE